MNVKYTHIHISTYPYGSLGAPRVAQDYKSSYHRLARSQLQHQTLIHVEEEKNPAEATKQHDEDLLTPKGRLGMTHCMKRRTPEPWFRESPASRNSRKLDSTLGENL